MLHSSFINVSIIDIVQIYYILIRVINMKSKLGMLLVTVSLLMAGYSSAGEASTNLTDPPLDQYNGKLKDLYDYTVSDKGPEISENELKSLNQLQSNNQSLRVGGPTYTYVRCYYVEDSSLYRSLNGGNLYFNYEWARNTDGSYYKLNGNWHNGSIVAFRNMFFTDARLNEIRNICENTLRNKININYYHRLFEVAADNWLSYNHTIWQNDNKVDNSEGINKIISFGDSLSDTNNMYNASQWKLPGKAWVEGRFSNGETWNEYLAEDLKLPLYNWAIGGSAGDTQYLVVPGLKQQVASWVNYSRSAVNYQPERSLATILIGGNDFITYDRSVGYTLSDVQDSVKELYANGIRHILILNLPDLTKAPVFGYKDDAYRAMVLEKVNSFNEDLPYIVAKLNSSLPNADIHIFDARKALDNILSNKISYGFSDTTSACLNVGNSNSMTYLWNINRSSECTNPNQFLFWDNMHITTKGHKVLETELLKQDSWLLQLAKATAEPATR